jgi:hypothetical protein
VPRIVHDDVAVLVHETLPPKLCQR